tara:strand:- start:44281 stop:45126 length:846 start_codon:yes stop_codon:yes gene_type:complete
MNRSKDSVANGALLTNYIQFKSFSWLYDQLFETVAAQSDSLKEKSFRIRHEVYCDEFGYEEAAKHADRLERDAYDERAEHSLLIHKRSGEAIGSVRIVPPNFSDLSQSFPLQDIFKSGRLRDEDLLENMCEISRLCMLKKFRVRSGDEGSPLGGVHDQEQETFVDRSCRRVARRIIPFAPIGLIQSSFDMASQRGLTHGCAILETRLINSLEQLGIICERIGPIIDYQGNRQPIIIDFLTTMNNLKVHQKAVWEMVTKNGELHDRLYRMRSKKQAEKEFST